MSWWIGSSLVGASSPSTCEPSSRLTHTSSGVLLANHGAVTYGPTIEVAYDRALYLEWVAEVWLRAHALAPAFTPHVLGDAEMAEVYAKIGGAYATSGRPHQGKQ